MRAKSVTFDETNEHGTPHLSLPSIAFLATAIPCTCPRSLAFSLSAIFRCFASARSYHMQPSYLSLHEEKRGAYEYLLLLSRELEEQLPDLIFHNSVFLHKILICGVPATLLSVVRNPMVGERELTYHEQRPRTPPCVRRAMTRVKRRV